MKRSMIAVCLLLLSPGTVMACIEDHNTGAGWFDQQSSGWTSYGTGAGAAPGQTARRRTFRWRIGGRHTRGRCLSGDVLAPRRAHVSPRSLARSCRWHADRRAGV